MTFFKVILFFISLQFSTVSILAFIKYHKDGNFTTGQFTMTTICGLCWAVFYLLTSIS